MKVLLNILKLTTSFVMAFSLIVGLLSCSSQPASQSPTVAPGTNPATLPEFDEGVMLLERANAWGALLISVPTADQSEALNNISGFIEPTAASDEKVQEIYNGWKTPESTLINSSLVSLQVNNNKYAIVRYNWVVKNSDGSENTVIQNTDWIMKDGKWYITVPFTQNHQIAESNEMIITITGLAQDEEATLRIGSETGSLEIVNTLFEYPVQGTGDSLIKTISPALEDGYYLLLLDSPGQYFRNPKGYDFMVNDSMIVNPTNKAISFKLEPRPAYPVAELVGDLSAPPKQPIQATITSNPPVPLWYKLLMPLVILVALIVVVFGAIVIWRRRSRTNHS